MGALAGFFAKPLVKWGGLALAGLAIALGVWLILRGEFSKGSVAGAAKVTTATQGETIRRTQDAVQKKDKADDEVSKTPYKDLVNGLD